MHKVELFSDEGRSLVIHCSPNTKLNLEENEEFRTQVFESSLRRNEEEEEDFVPNMPLTSSQALEIDSANLPSTSAKALEKAVWLQNDVQLLLSTYKEVYPGLGKNVLLKTKKKMWEYVTQKINSYGKDFSPCQVENKWKSLERAFKIKLQQNKKTGHNRATCPYEKELAEILLERPSIVPTYSLGATLDSGKSRREILCESGISTEPIVEVSDPELVPESPTIESPSNEETELNELKEEDILRPRKIKRTNTIAGELRLWRQQTEEQNRHKKEYQKAKLDAYNKRTAVLKGLLDALKNNTS